jgi:hypothetical protein
MIDKLMVREIVDMLEEHYPMEDLLVKMDEFDRGKVVGHIEVIISLKRLLLDEDEVI